MTSLGRLTSLLPPPSPGAPSLDWAESQRRLGVPAFPDEFVELVHRYGSARFCHQLRLLHPSPHSHLDLVEVTLRSRVTLGDKEFGATPAEVPRGVTVAPETLIQWGMSSGGDYCLWDATHSDPNQWTLVFTDIDKLDWGYHPGGVTDFLLDWMTARAAPIPVWDIVGTHLEQITPYCDFLDANTDRIHGRDR